jgi:hypothetical protein
MLQGELRDLSAEAVEEEISIDDGRIDAALDPGPKYAVERLARARLQRDEL